jgi:hypothetical protein
MNKYHHQKNPHKKTKRLKLINSAVTLVVLTALGAAVYVAYGFLNDANQESAPVTSKVSELGSFEGVAQNTYANEYFEFKSSRDFELNQRGSQIGSKYQYVGRRNMNADYLLTIYINGAPADQPTAHVVPVEVVGDVLKVTQASPHCKGDEEGPREWTNIQKEYNGVSFLCNRNTNQLTAMAGVPGKGTSFIMKNSEGNDVQVALLFEDVSTTFRSDAFIEVLRSFRLK